MGSGQSAGTAPPSKEQVPLAFLHNSGRGSAGMGALLAGPAFSIGTRYQPVGGSAVRVPNAVGRHL